MEKILFGTDKMTRTDSKITLSNIRINLNAYTNLSVEELDALQLLTFVNILMVEDRVQNLDSVTCNILQLYFYDNLFNPNENSKIKHKARLNKRTIELLLNEHSVLDDQETNETIRQYANDNNINLTKKKVR